MIFRPFHPAIIAFAIFGVEIGNEDASVSLALLPRAARADNDVPVLWSAGWRRDVLLGREKCLGRRRQVLAPDASQLHAYQRQLVKRIGAPLKRLGAELRSMHGP